jgi:hypothetical protein
MAYVPPKLRKEKTIDEKNEESMKILQEASDKHFPSLSGNAPTISRTTLSYAEKAKEWELKDRIDARMAQIREEKNRQDELEQVTITTRTRELPKPMPLSIVVPPPVIPREDEWIRVEKKVRKPKKEINYDDELAYRDDLDEDDESLWD